MKLLLDTQIFLWLIAGDPRLPRAWHVAITDNSADVALSVASIWEATIKFQIGKLPLPGPAEMFLPAARESHQISSLPINEEAIVELAKLPLLHRDPFDRIIVAQAIQDQRILVTADQTLRQYPVRCLS
ncbi:type II toxin-antitoxin system VapC family toxin [Anatilimnocola floriformis]|uniref:type II toxin-antitoxin system VapC family toxin n=1 Tax=Anatilimnocola floriformis TaxID=2948575 RepID=UPI0020C4A7C1|nr:type II toxin-antitoxin system VapC family toxin [Anatilimnocola floriformis]